jgi:hypothetical protein
MVHTRVKSERIPRHCPEVTGVRLKRIKLIAAQIASPREARTVARLGINHNVAKEIPIHVIRMAAVLIIRVWRSILSDSSVWLRYLFQSTPDSIAKPGTEGIR